MMFKKGKPTISALLFFSVGLILFVQSCNNNENTKPMHTVEGRWFTQKQFEMGEIVFNENCARCHGRYGEGIVENWRRTNPDGSFPPPPLNGTAHTWHHPFEVLMKTINEGGAPIGGIMPAFTDSLSEEEKIAVVAYFQSLWDDKTYHRWVKMNSEQ